VGEGYCERYGDVAPGIVAGTVSAGVLKQSMSPQAQIY